MSEYQCYEWQTIDRPLTSQERAAVHRLSSHITVTAAGAWVDYNWSDFKHKPLDVLARYFDAFHYMANWGSKRLAFRFPAGLLDPTPLQPYIVDPYISLQTVGDYHILSFDVDDEEPSDDWIEPGAWLGTLAPLRNDILRGDYRLLYLAWLMAVELDGGLQIADDEPEPAVPPGLHQLTAALQTFVDWSGLSKHLLAATAQASVAIQDAPDADFVTAIQQLSRQECNDFLLRLVKEEAHLALTLRRRLQGMTQAAPNRPASAQRRVEDLLAMQAERAEAARRQHLQKMEELSLREPELWQEVERLIETYQPRDYDEATRHLVQLRQLTEHQSTEAAFQARVDTLAERYRRRPSLMERWRKSRLI